MIVTKNYVYGAQTPDLSAQVDEQIFKANVLRNKLCELELKKREWYYETLRRHAPLYVETEEKIEALTKELEEIREKIQEERSKQRTKKPKGENVDKWTARAAEIKEELKPLRATLKNEKQKAKLDRTIQSELSKSNESYKMGVKEAKSEIDLYWCTSGLVIQSCKSFASGAPPRFKRYDGTGQLAVQVQNGMSSVEIMGKDTRVYIDDIEGNKANLYFRIGSEDRKPIFAKIPFTMHRQLPADARIKWVFLERRKMADQFRWQIRLTLETMVNENRDKDSWIAVHFGWTNRGSGLYVCSWKGSDGKKGRVYLEATHVMDYQKLDRLRSQRDHTFNIMKDALEHHIKVNKDSLPKWLLDDANHLSRWRSAERLHRLIDKMAEADLLKGQVLTKLNEAEFSYTSHFDGTDSETLLQLFEETFPGLAPIGKPERANKTSTIYQKYKNPETGQQYSLRFANHSQHPNEDGSCSHFDILSLEDLIRFQITQEGPTCFESWLTTTMQSDVRKWRNHARLGKRVVNRRRDLYRNFAFQAAKSYGVLYYSKSDVADLIRNSNPEDLQRDNSSAHRSANMAAPSELLSYLKEKFPLNAIEVPTKNLTIKCAKCGFINKRSKDRIECGGCADVYYSETNAVENTVEAGQQLQADGALDKLKEKHVEGLNRSRERLAKMQQAMRDAREKKKLEAAST